jgi:hypothetical protein
MQHLFLSDNSKTTPSDMDFIQLTGLLPKHNYSCYSEVFYEGQEYINKSKLVETDFGSEYVTYIYI